MATTQYLSYRMKQPNILLLVVIALLPLMLVSCSLLGGAPAPGGWSGTAFDDGIIYAGTRDGRVVAVNSSTQDVLWSYAIITTGSSGMSCGETSAATRIYTTPIADGDLVYVGTYSGQVLAFSSLARSQNLTFPQQRYGEWKWDCPIGDAKINAIVADLLVSGDAIYVSSSNGRVYSLAQEFGDLNWESEILDERHRKLWTSGVTQGDALYVSTLDGGIYALSLESGQLLPDRSFKSETGFASPPVIDGDTIFLGSFDRHLYAVEIGGNASIWKFPPEEPGGNWFWASPIVSEGIVYAGCLDGKLYAIEAKTGEKVWEFDAESPIVSSPVLMDNLLMVIDESGTLYVFDLSAELADEAMPLKIVSIGAEVRSSFCAQGGLVYIRGEHDTRDIICVVDIDKGQVRKVDLNIKE